jgi:dethiobiotin synthetase
VTAFVITGTDTGIGKTRFAAALAGALDGYYWKPIQAGLEEPTDSQIVVGLSGLPADRVLPESYRLKSPLSPHRAAQLDGIAIDPAKLMPPDTDRPLVIEGAGGVLVPLTDTTLFADIFARWQLPVILCARTALGTINHSLLAIEALRARSISILGIAFIGDTNEDSEATIARLGKVRRLGRLPWIDPMSAEMLHQKFAENFDLGDFTA